jgi:O-antigen/teichoic acid export membrane protein
MALKRFAIDIASLSGARIFQTAAAFVTLPIIARLLGPAEYGLVALAMSFVISTIFLADAGMGQSLVRTPASEIETWSSVFWTILAIGAALSLLLAGAGWLAGQLFREPRLTSLLLTLSIVPLMVALVAPATAELQQRQRFRDLAAIETVSALAGIGVAIILAFRGAGAWAIVAQQLTLWGVKSAILLSCTRFRPRFVWSRIRLAGHLGFARDNAGATILYSVARQIDPFVIGRFLGTVPLGFYALATRIMWLPHQLISSPVQNTLYVRMVELREDKAALRDLCLIVTGGIALLVFPGVAIFAASSDAWFETFLSREWLPAAAVFTCLAPIAALQTVSIPMQALLMATGQMTARLRQSFEVTVIWIITLAASVSFGVIAVACAFALVNLVYLPRSLQLTLPVIDCPMPRYLGVLMAPAVASAAIVVMHLSLRAWLHPAHLAEILLSLVELALIYAAMGWTARGRLQAEIRTLRGLILRSNAPQPVA